MRGFSFVVLWFLFVFYFVLHGWFYFIFVGFFLFGLGFFVALTKLNVICKRGKDEAPGPSHSVFHTNKLPAYSQDHY